MTAVVQARLTKSYGRHRGILQTSLDLGPRCRHDSYGNKQAAGWPSSARVGWSSSTRSATSRTCASRRWRSGSPPLMYDSALRLFVDDGRRSTCVHHADNGP